MRRVPTGRSTTRPAPFSTLRCCETAGRLTGSSRAISPTARGRVARLSKIARRVGSPSDAKHSAWLVNTNRKPTLTAAWVSSAHLVDPQHAEGQQEDQGDDGGEHQRAEAPEAIREEEEHEPATTRRTAPHT